jgi:hypothetical protein
MSQERAAMSQQEFIPAAFERPARPRFSALFRHLAKLGLVVLRAPQTQIGVLVNVTSLAFAMVAVRPDSGFPTMQLLLTYNAVILGYLSSFWGLWIDAPMSGFGGLPYSPRRVALAERERLLWSIAPTVLGGSGVFLPLCLPQDIGTLMLITGFMLLIALEALGPRRGLPKADYKPLRWTISFIAIVLLVDVLANQRWSVRILF